MLGTELRTAQSGRRCIMKRVGMILLAVGLIGLGIAVAQEVTSVNVVGFSKIVVPPGPDLVCFTVMFDPVGVDPASGGTNYFLDVFGTNQLTKNNLAHRADRIYKFVPPDSYETYFMKPDGQFYKQGDPSPVNPAVVAGDAFWLQQPETMGTAKELILAGQVVEIATNLQTMVSGFQMVGYPFTSDVGLNETGFKDSPGSKAANLPHLADRVYVYQGGGVYQTYGLKSDGWHPATNYSGPPTTDVVPLGRGLWYEAKSNAWTWIETNKYLGNL
jgi:hypothetical protein